MAGVSNTVSAARIAECEKLIRPHVRRTPIIEIDAAEVGLASGRLFLKLELFQHSGSFKARGAFANLLTRDVPASGVVAASGGNHGAAVAYAAMKLKRPAKIFVPSVASAAKIQRIREYGADLVIEGDRYADALAASETWMRKSGAMPVHAFDQDETILGQGSIGVELEQQAPDIDTLLVSVGGGGLIAGIAAWYGGRIKVIGVEPFAAPTLTKALHAGRPVDAEAGGFAADSLAPRRVGERFSHRPKIRSSCRARWGRRHQNGAAGPLAGVADRRRTGGSCGAVGSLIRCLSAGERTSRRHLDQRR